MYRNRLPESQSQQRNRREKSAADLEERANTKVF
jgi:hypothetical protein